MSFNLYQGPDGIIPEEDGIYRFKVPPNKRLLLTFSFHAWFEHAIWICSNETGDIIEMRGNYYDNSDWISDNNNSSAAVIYAVVAFHKNSPPRGDRPWVQSRPLKVHKNEDNGRIIVIGYEDVQWNEYKNAVVSGYQLA